MSRQTLRYSKCVNEKDVRGWKGECGGVGMGENASLVFSQIHLKNLPEQRRGNEVLAFGLFLLCLGSDKKKKNISVRACLFFFRLSEQQQ